MEKPVWMSDPLVADIDPAKLEFLQTVFFESKGKTQKELIPFLITMNKKIKLQNLSFTEAEISAIIAAIRSHSTEEELTQINRFMEMRKKSTLP